MAEVHANFYATRRNGLIFGSLLMTESRKLLQHFLAALAYRTQKALRGAPETFADFRVAEHVRTPHELVWHMTGVIGYARTMVHGGTFKPPRLTTFAEEITRSGK